MVFLGVGLVWFVYRSYALVIFLRYKVVRGTLDFGGVINRVNARSRYGGELHSISFV